MRTDVLKFHFLLLMKKKSEVIHLQIEVTELTELKKVSIYAPHYLRHKSYRPFEIHNNLLRSQFFLLQQHLNIGL